MYLNENLKNDIKVHTAKRKELELKVADTMKIWHQAQQELDNHNKQHPNYARLKRNQPSDEECFEQGRSSTKSKGPGYYPGV